MIENPQSRSIYRFGDLVVDTGTCRLSAGDKEIPIPKLSFDLLIALLDRAPNVVTVSELMDEVWGDVVVAEETVTQRVKLLRDLLGHDRRDYIRTVRGRGFRLAAPVEAVVSDGAGQTSSTRSNVTEHPAHRDRWSRLTLAVAAAAVLFLIFYANTPDESVRHLPDSQAAPAAETAAKTIAVVPFLNASGRPENEYLSDGITETLLHILTRATDLQVTARTSAFAFKNKNEDIRVIGEKLGVRTVLEGSVQKVGNRLRITARLVDTDSGSYLWSENYDREDADIFAVQDDIGSSVVAALTATLQDTHTTPPNYGSTENADAYNAYLQGRYFFQRRSEENFRRALDYFGSALISDPEFALAHAALARTHIRMAAVGYVRADDGYESARISTERALALDSELAEAYIALGERKTLHEWDWSEADAAYRRALSLSPHNIGAVIGAARIAGAFGRFQDSIRFLEDALERDPLSFEAHHLLGHFYFYTGRNAEATDELKKAIELYPGITGTRLVLAEVYLAESKPEAALQLVQQENGDAWRRAGLAYAYSALGHEEQAREAMEELIEHDRNISAYQIATAFAYGEDYENAIEWVELAFEQRDSAMLQLNGAPGLAALHDDARYKRHSQKTKGQQLTDSTSAKASPQVDRQSARPAKRVSLQLSVSTTQL